MNMPAFYRCEHCGNLIGMIEDKGVPVVCCGEEMTKLAPNTVDAAQEKHVPVAEVHGNIVRVAIGSVPHPMLKEHFIEWVYLWTKKGGQRKTLTPDDAPTVSFALTPDDEPLAFYAYCNLHGLWMAKC